ncbi:iron ABC transporter permease [Micromonospora sp. NPDC005324]|uniref:FecCD family ABC transporter permease n=1 Tax=Micromonospora sp. NPDC005324 TaxID=3157033 RepID=UPI0033BAF54A
MVAVVLASPARKSTVTYRRRVGAVLLCLLVVAVAAVASLAIGARAVSLAEIWSALSGADGTEGEVIVRSLRVPRTVLGLVVGGSLGTAGALIQAHTRNPLADPGLLGVSAGASLAVVFAISVLGLPSVLGYVWFAFAGALLTSVLVFAIGTLAAGRRTNATPLTLALAGTAVSALFSGLTAALLLVDATTLDAYRFWVVGSVTGRGYDVLLPVLPFLAVGLALAFAQAPALNALGLGEDIARGLGLSLARTRLLGIVAITLLTGASVATCGPIAFVGLVVPHVARLLVGPDQRWLVPLAGLLGAALLLAADVLGRVLAPPGEVQVGVTLAFVGAPFFIALVRRRRMAAL